MNAMMFLSIRAAHVLVAGLWIGSTVFGAAWLMPAIDAAGPSGGQVMRRIVQNGYSTYMSAIGLTTLLTGLYLLWRFTGGFDPSVAATHGIVFGTGGVAGILAGAIGGAVVGRSAKELSALGALLSRPIEDIPARGSCVQHAAMLRHRMKIGTQAVIALQCIALMSMAVGHYGLMRKICVRISTRRHAWLAHVMHLAAPEGLSDASFRLLCRAHRSPDVRGARERTGVDRDHHRQTPAPQAYRVPARPSPNSSGLKGTGTPKANTTNGMTATGSGRRLPAPIGRAVLLPRAVRWGYWENGHAHVNHDHRWDNDHDRRDNHYDDHHDNGARARRSVAS